jgi:hypothetical protein
MSPEPTNAGSISPSGSDAESEFDQNAQLRAPRRSQWPPQAPQGMGSGYGGYPSGYPGGPGGYPGGPGGYPGVPGGYPGGYTGYPPPPWGNTGPPPPGYPQPQPQQPIPPINQPVPVHFTSTVDWDAADKAQSGDDVQQQYAEAYQLMKELPFVFQKFSLRVGRMMEHFNECSAAYSSSSRVPDAAAAKLRLLLIRLNRVVNVLPYMVDIPYWAGDNTPNPNAFHYNLYWSHPEYSVPQTYARKAWELWFPNLTFNGSTSNAVMS